MRITVLTSIATGLLLLAVQAFAEDYAIVSGVLTDAETGASETLKGSLTAELSVTALDLASLSARIVDFELRTGSRSFLPAVPAEYDGQRGSLLLRIADSVRLDERGVELLYLRSGGELVDVTGDEVTFRYFDFQSTPRMGPPEAGDNRTGHLPRRFSASGTLYQVDQSFQLFEDTCPPIEVFPRPPDGGVIISAEDRNLFHSVDSFDLSAGNSAHFVGDAEAGAVVRGVAGGAWSSIDGELRRQGGAFFANPAGVSLNSQFLKVTLTSEPPTLEELLIRAPDGAQVWVENEVLFVRSDGDLFLDGPLPELPGITAMHIIAGGSIHLENFAAPANTDVQLWADNTIDVPELPDPVVVCIRPLGMRPIFPAERTEVGSFSLIASTASRGVEIDVLPWHPHNRLRLGSRRLVPVALLGSEDFDVREVDAHSLRLGPAQASPKTLYRGKPAFRRDVNRDGHLDLLAFFKLHRLELAYGDTDLCLTVESRGGETLEGCDAIETRPRLGRTTWHNYIRSLLRARIEIFNSRR